MEIKQIFEKEEINKVLDLFIQVFSEEPYYEKWTKKLAFKRLSEIYNLGKEFCLYIEEKNEVIGMIFCQTQTWEDGMHIIIEDTAVHPRFRNKGVGEHLVTKLEELARKRGIVSIDLLTNTKSKAVDFWTKNNYKQNGYIQFTKHL